MPLHVPVDRILCNRIADIYRELTGANRFVKIRPSPSAAVEFDRTATALGLGLREAIVLSTGRFSEDWCQETFGSNYPPINVVLGHSSRTWLSRTQRRLALKEETPAQRKDAASGIVRNILSTMKLRDALTMVRSGLWPTDAKVRAMVGEILEARAAGRGRRGPL